MSYTYQEDWVHIDDWEKQVRQYEAEIEDLKLQVKNATEDESFLLSELYRIRNLASNNGENIAEEALDCLITSLELTKGWVERTT